MQGELREKLPILRPDAPGAVVLNPLVISGAWGRSSGDRISMSYRTNPVPESCCGPIPFLQEERFVTR
jgi:hypothetical protein